MKNARFFVCVYILLYTFSTHYCYWRGLIRREKLICRKYSKIGININIMRFENFKCICTLCIDRYIHRMLIFVNKILWNKCSLSRSYFTSMNNNSNISISLMYYKDKKDFVNIFMASLIQDINPLVWYWEWW